MKATKVGDIIKILIPVLAIIGMLGGAFIFYNICDFTSLPLNKEGVVSMKKINALIGGLLGSFIGVMMGFYVPMFVQAVILSWKTILGIVLFILFLGLVLLTKFVS